MVVLVFACVWIRCSAAGNGNFSEMRSDSSLDGASDES